MRIRKRNKWRKRLGKVAAPVVTAGAVAGATVLAGGRDLLETVPETLEGVLETIPESVQGAVNIVRETGSLLTTSLKGMNFVLENFFMIGTAAGVGFVGYKMYQSKDKN